MDTAYGRYDGFIKIGKTANMGYILTHPLSAIDEGCTATLLCSFRVQGYRTANVDFNPDVQDGKTTIPVEIVGAGTFDDGETIREFGADVFFTWMQHEFVIVGATSDTQLKFGSSEEKKNRLFLDDIKVVRADDKTAEAAESKTASRRPRGRGFGHARDGNGHRRRYGHDAAHNGQPRVENSRRIRTG